MNLSSEQKKLSEEEFLSLFEKYKTTGDISARNQIVLNFSYIPQTVAFQLKGISQGYAQVDDMINQGIITLIDCIDRFDPDKGIKFEYYAFMRVKGGVIDLVRKQDWIPRRVREMSKRIAEAQMELSNKLMREPTMEELSEYMAVPVEKLAACSNEINNSVVFSFEELIQNMSQMGSSLESDTNEDFSPEKKLIKQEMRQVLKEAIDGLTEREKTVVTLYYYENLMLSDIADVLEISVQRVSQINTKAVSKLKVAMEKYIYG